MRSALMMISIVALAGIPGCRHPSTPAPVAAATPGTDPDAPGPATPPPIPDPPPAPATPPIPETPPIPPTPPTPPTKSGPVGKQGEPCGAGGSCEAGLKCLEFYGIAGPAGGKLSSCEIPCTRKTRCPTGQTCTAISDGPGSVCRAM